MCYFKVILRRLYEVNAVKNVIVSSGKRRNFTMLILPNNLKYIVWNKCVSVYIKTDDNIDDFTSPPKGCQSSCQNNKIHPDIKPQF